MYRNISAFFGKLQISNFLVAICDSTVVSLLHVHIQYTAFPSLMEIAVLAACSHTVYCLPFSHGHSCNSCMFTYSSTVFPSLLDIAVLAACSHAVYCLLFPRGHSCTSCMFTYSVLSSLPSWT